MTSPMMPTRYFRDDNDLQDGFPWASYAGFEKDMQEALDEMKLIGIEKGVLEVTPEGWLKGHGHPDKWFDAVDEENEKIGSDPAL